MLLLSVLLHCLFSRLLGLISICLLISGANSYGMIVQIQSAVPKTISVKIEGVDYALDIVPGPPVVLDAEEIESHTLLRPTVCYISTSTKTDFLPMPEKLGAGFIAVCISFTAVLLSIRLW